MQLGQRASQSLGVDARPLLLITLDARPLKALSLMLGDTKVYEP